MTQTFLSELKKQPTYRYDILDFDGIRNATMDNVKAAVSQRFPLENDDYTLAVDEVDYDGPDSYSLKEQKEAILKGRSLGRRLKGRWTLTDKLTGKPVSQTKKVTLLNVPYITPRGTYIRNGHEMTIGHVLRLNPGVYSRVKANGLYEAHVNVEQGTGSQFKMEIDPETGVFNIRKGNVNARLYPILRSMGIPDKKIEEMWGTELLNTNRLASSGTMVTRNLQKLLPKEASDGTKANYVTLSPDDAKALLESFGTMRLDPVSTEATLGKPYDRVSPDMLLGTSDKLLRLAKGTSKADNRDSMQFQKVYGPAEIFAERIVKDGGRLGRALLWKATNKKNLDFMSSGALNAHVDGVFNESKLAQYIDGSSPFDAIDSATRITRLGEGGLSSQRLASDEMRLVQNSFKGYIDPIRSPESLAVGLQMFMTQNTRKGHDGLLYTQLFNPRTGKKEWVDSKTAATANIATSEYMDTKDPYIPLVGGERGVHIAPRKDVDYYLSDDNNMFSLGSNMVPFKGGVKGMRLLMGCLAPDTNIIIKKADNSIFYGHIENYEWHQGDQAHSVDQTTGKTTWRGVERLVPNYNKIDMLEVKLKSGRKLTTTVNHKWVTMSEQGTLEKITAQNLVMGTPIPREGWLDFPMEEGITSVTIGKGAKHNSFSGFEMELTEGVGYMLGLYTAEGWLQGDRGHGYGTTSWAVDRPELQKRLCAVLDDLDLKYKIRRNGADPHKKVVVNHSGFARWLHANLETGSYKKKVAGLILQAPLGCREGFIAGFFDGDGTVMDRRGYARLITGVRSYDLIEGLSNLFSTLQIDTVVRETTALDKPIYLLEVRSQHLHKVPVLTHNEKAKRMSTLKLWSGKKNIDYIPMYKDLHASVLQRSTRKEHFRHRAYVNQHTKQSLQERISSEECIWLDSEIRWDSVVGIKDVDPVAITYDLDLNDHTFSVGQGIFVHNSKYATQALPLVNREAALTRSADGTGTGSVERLAGKYTGAVQAPKAGVVKQVRKDKIIVEYIDGEQAEHELYDNFPANQKGYLRSHAEVKAGDTFKKGQALASSNYTANDGVFAGGLNLRTAFMNFKGSNYEDAIVISEAAAKRLTSEHMYNTKLPKEKHLSTDTKRYVNMFPGKYTADQFDKMDPNGMIKTGSVVDKGDPLILGIRENQPSPGTAGRRTFTDVSEKWEHDYPGVITDVVTGRENHTVFSRANVPMKVGDKMCYSEDTDLLTSKGWKNITTVTLADELATLDPDTKNIQYINPSALHSYDHSGSMHVVETTQVSLCVTEEHKHYAALRKGKEARWEYGLHKASDLYGKKYRLEKTGKWKGIHQDTFKLPPVVMGVGRTMKLVEGPEVSIEAYLTIMGIYLSDGNSVWQPSSGSYGFDISQTKGNNKYILQKAFTRLGVKWCEGSHSEKIRVYSKHWASYLKQFGKAPEKYIPDNILTLSPDLLAIFYEWFMFGDGHRTQAGHGITTVSSRLAGDWQRLCLHMGMSATVRLTDKGGPRIICGRNCFAKPSYTVSTYRYKNQPTINHGHAKTQKGQTEYWDENYSGKVYCPEMPFNHIVYTRRNGKTVWSGNSNRYGSKGVVAEVVPDNQMPLDKKGKPFEILMSPLSVVSRTNPAQLIEVAYGKIAQKRGKAIDLPAFMTEDAAEKAMADLKENGLSDTDDLLDPETGKTIPKVFNGMAYYYKLKHTAESKESGRGTAGYTMDNVPASGGYEGSKRLGGLETSALIGHSVMEVLKDAKIVKGQANDEFWRAFKFGKTPTMPGTPLVHSKFFEHLKGAGINVRKGKSSIDIFGMNNDDVGRLSQGRQVKSADTFETNTYRPIDGGLFGKDVFGPDGNQWGYIPLDEPIPNPVMADSLRRSLDMTLKDFEAVAEGRKELNGDTGGNALKKALGKIDLTREVKYAMEDIKRSTGTRRDNAIKKYRALASIKLQKMHPKDFMLDRIPVLPPKYRPITSVDGMTMVADANYLYKALIDANKDFKDAREQLPDDMLGDARAQIYRGFKAITGLHDPDGIKLQQKNVGGLLKWVFGKSSPKYGAFQRRVVGSAVDMVGRGTVTPNPALKLNQIGLPEEQAWNIYEPFVVKALIQGGYKATDAVKMTAEKHPAAYSLLQKAVEERPVILNRAPSLHKFSLMGFWPVLTKGSTIQVSPSIVGPFNMDFDGDAANFHVPVSRKAAQEVASKMMPEQNLLDIKDFKAHYKPMREYLQGLNIATRQKPGPPVKVFKSKADAKEAYRKGEIDVDDPIRIVDKS